MDGDADRLMVVDEQGAVVDGDCLMALGAEDLIGSGDLPDNTVVATIMSNLALDHTVARLGGKVVRTTVGDRYVVEEMRRCGFGFGGEQSGHLVYLNHATTGDGILAALRLLAAMQRAGKPLSELRQLFAPFPQALVNINVAEKRPLATLTQTTDLIGSIKKKLGGDGRVLVRYSGTESKARVLVEGPAHDLVRSCAEQIAKQMQEELS